MERLGITPGNYTISCPPEQDAARGAGFFRDDGMALSLFTCYDKKVFFVCGKNKVTDLLLDDRVNYICSADYQEGGDLDSLVKCIIQEKALAHKLQLKQREQRRRESKNQISNA